MQVSLTQPLSQRLHRYLTSALAYRARLGWSFFIFLTDGVFALATGVILARLLGPVQVGAMAAVIAGLSLLNSLFEGGVGTHLTRAVAQDASSFRTHLAQAMGVRLLYTLPLMLLLAAPHCWLGIIPGTGPLLWTAAGLYLFAMMAYGTIFSAYSGRQAFSSWWAVATPARLLAFLGAVAAAYVLDSIAAAYLLNALLILAALGLIYRHNGCRGLNLNPTQAAAILKASLPFLLWNLTSGLTLRFDTFWLGVTRSAYETGLYTAAYQLFLYLGSICIPLYTLAYPVLARRFAEDRPRFRKAAWLSLGIMALVSGLAAAFLVTAAPALIHGLYGQAFAEAVPLASLLGYGLVPLALNRILAGVLIAGHREWFVALSGVGSCLVNVGLNLWLIPIYGAIAAVYTTLSAETLCALFYGGKFALLCLKNR
jgi:O-antigen/teichoic acid export membrane protein